MEGIWGALLSAFVGAVPVGIRSSGGLPEVYIYFVLFSLVGHFALVFGHYNFLLIFFIVLVVSF